MDFDAWPEDSNELMIRLWFWFSCNFWLVIDEPIPAGYPPAGNAALPRLSMEIPMQVAFKTPQGTYVTLDPGTGKFAFDRTVRGPWETFELEIVDAQGASLPAAPSGALFTPPADPFAAPVGDYTNPEFLRDVIQYGIKVAGLREATDADYAYWTSKWPEMTARGVEINVPDYAWRRLIGWQATGADKAKAGPYA
jgi:hypothetical protein